MAAGAKSDGRILEFGGGWRGAEGGRGYVVMNEYSETNCGGHLHHRRCHKKCGGEGRVETGADRAFKCLNGCEAPVPVKAGIINC